MQATLWPRGVRGVLSHETALSLFELSDVAPDKVHITVPTSLRVQRAVPTYMVVHRADVPPTDIQQFERMPITTPARAIQDCLYAHAGPAIVYQAIRDGRRAGLINEKVAAAMEYLADREP